jgi:hypothetical protein
LEGADREEGVEKSSIPYMISMRYIVKAKAIPEAKGDALEIGIFNEANLPNESAFAHRSILSRCPVLIPTNAQHFLPIVSNRPL